VNWEPCFATRTEGRTDGQTEIWRSW